MARHLALKVRDAVLGLQCSQAARSFSAMIQPHISESTERDSSHSWLEPVDELAAETSSRRWVFLGCPGVGKGTYASRLSKFLDVPHISTGDLVRAEVKSGSRRSAELESLMKQGKLISDEIIFELLSQRLEQGASEGENGFILDGFPRTTKQAEILGSLTDIDLVLNLKLREEVLVSKCLGRRTCSECKGNFNTADIFLKGENGLPDIVMPPLSPPESCAHKMTIRSDDTEEIVRQRLQNYWNESRPVEEYFRKRGLLTEFEICGGIPETWPRLLAALNVEPAASSGPLPVAA